MTEPASPPSAAPVPAAQPVRAMAVPQAWPEDMRALHATLETLFEKDANTCAAEAAKALAKAQQDGRADLQIVAIFWTGFANYLLARDAPALSSMERAHELAVLEGDAYWQGRALMGIGLCYGAMGEHAVAVGYMERALDIRQAIGDTAGVASTLNNLGIVCVQLPGFLDRAAQLFEQAHGHWHAAGLAAQGTIALCNLASARVAKSHLLSTDDPPAARLMAQAGRDAALEAVRESDGSGERRYGIDARLQLAMSLVALGEPQEAAVALGIARANLDDFSSPHLEPQYSLARGRIERSRGDPAKAIAALRTGLDACDGRNRSGVELELLAELADAQEEAGDTPGALQTMRRLHGKSMAIQQGHAQRRAELLHVRLEVDHARHAAEVQRLRARRLEKENEALTREARQDQVTGLPNRRAFEQVLVSRLEGAHPGGACVLVDIDHFKQINDSFSHGIGDHVLRQVGALMRDTMRTGDLAARFGGDEFALLLDRVDPALALQICERLCEALAKHDWQPVAPGLRVTGSFGVALIRPGEDARQLVSRADARLYAAKANGRDRVEIEA